VPLLLPPPLRRRRPPSMPAMPPSMLSSDANVRRRLGLSSSSASATVSNGARPLALPGPADVDAPAAPELCREPAPGLEGTPAPDVGRAPGPGFGPVPTPGTFNPDPAPVPVPRSADEAISSGEASAAPPACLLPALPGAVGTRAPPFAPAPPEPVPMVPADCVCPGRVGAGSAAAACPRALLAPRPLPRLASLPSPSLQNAPPAPSPRRAARASGDATAGL